MKAIIFARVSTEEQREAGNSLPAQLHRIKTYVEQNTNLELYKEFTFDESAYKSDRSKFDEIINLIQDSDEVIALCCDKVDRLMRNFLTDLPRMSQMLENGKLELHFTSENLIVNRNSSASDKFMFNVTASLSQYYSDAISDNTKRALEQKLRAGEWIGQPRLGYINITLEDGRKSLDKDPYKAPLIQKGFQLFAQGNHSIQSLCNTLNKMGLRSRKDKNLTPSALQYILRDKFYVGIMTSKGREYPHIYPQLVSESLFNEVQSILDRRHQRSQSKYGTKRFVFKGLLTCHNCGCKITAEIKKQRYVYYRCTNGKGVCEKIYVNEKELLRPIQDTLSQLSISKERAEGIVTELKKINNAQTQFHQDNINRIQEEYQKTQEKVDRLLDLLLDNSITREDYDKKLQELKEYQRDLNQQLEEYTQADENFHITAEKVISLANRARDLFDSSKTAEKQRLLKLLLSNCYLEGRNLHFELREPFKSILETRDYPEMLRGSDSNRRPLD